MAEMTDRQREFWRALTAPFPRDAYKVRDGAKGKKYTYIEPRTIMNRLDDVVGPSGWNMEFRETQRGIICRLTLYVPGNADTWKAVTREGGGGFRDMQNDDSSFKTGFSSAIKTAAAAFGIGRELYGEGMPAYCADLHNVEASGMPSNGAGSGPPPREYGQDERPKNGYGHYGNDLKPPYGKVGKASYAWAKKCGEHFGQDVIGRMTTYAEKRKKSKFTSDWDEAFLDEVLHRTVEWLQTLDNYNGECGPPRAERAPEGRQEPAAPKGENYVSKLVGPISAAINALIHKQVGREPSDGEIKAMIVELAASVPNGNGVRGEVFRTFRGMTDEVWLQNLLKAANRKIEELAATEVTQEENIPF